MHIDPSEIKMDVEMGGAEWLFIIDKDSYHNHLFSFFGKI